MSDHLAGIHAELALRRLAPELAQLTSQHQAASYALEQAHEHVRQLEATANRYTPPSRESWEWWAAACGVLFTAAIAGVLMLVWSSLIWRTVVAVGWLTYITILFIVEHRDHSAKAERSEQSFERTRQSLREARQRIQAFERERERAAEAVASKTREIETVRASLSFRP